MKTLEALQRTAVGNGRSPVADSQGAEARVLAACRAAAGAEENFAIKALIAGLALLEFRAAFPPRCHRGNTGTFLGNPQKDPFRAWVAENGIPERSAYRWMEGAERVAVHCLGMRMADVFRPVIEVDAVAIPLSQALTAPEQELPGKALEFRQAVFDFMADKTLGEAARAALDGESPASRISRAACGEHGGSGDRKDWPTFVARHLKVVTTMLVIPKTSRHPARARELEADQRTEIAARFDAAIRAWPAWLLETIKAAAARELKLSDVERGRRAK